VARMADVNFRKPYLALPSFADRESERAITLQEVAASHGKKDLLSLL
jgi:hypothetical protein